MYILAFDTSSNSLSIALNKDQENLEEITISPSSNQSELLLVKIAQILKNYNLSYQDLDLISTTNGPGSFTGSRIGLSAARIMKLSLKKPLILLNSCQVIAYKYQEQLSNHKNIFVALDARANEIFYANYQSINDITQNNIKPQITTINNIKTILPQENYFLCGSGANIIDPNNLKKDVIEAKYIGYLAFLLSQQKQYSQNLNPLYLRSPKITKRKK